MFEITENNYKKDNVQVSIYVHCKTEKANPLEIGEDIKSFMEFMENKYNKNIFLSSEDLVSIFSNEI